MKKLLEYVASILAADSTIQSATQGRVYLYQTEQGVHEYPIIFWRVITQTPVAQDLSSVGEAFRAEIQIDAFAEDALASARLAQAVFDAFNNAPKSDGILDAYADEITPVYADEDETIKYSVRVIVNFIQT